MTLASVLLLNLVVIAACMLLVWVVSLTLHDASIVDIAWGLGFVVIAWLTYYRLDINSSRSFLIAVLVSIWGIRLALYLAWRNLGNGEDHRYRAMRKKWGSRFPAVSLLTVFWLQAVIMFVVAMPVQAGQFGDAELGWLDGIGLFVWLIGLLFESLGDWQLARFKANPANTKKVMDHGLWRYTRHPNYFGDFLVWWGLYLIAIAGSAWWTLFSPLVMSLFLMRISGVPLLERSLRNNRPDYLQYMEKTSSFFPWPPQQEPLNR